MKVLYLGILFLCIAVPARAAVELRFPGLTSESFSDTKAFESYKLPIGPYSDGKIPTLVAEGQQQVTAWHVTLSGGTTLGIMDSLRQQIEAIGFELLYECETQECGGFDFRFQTEVLPEPSMHIDLGDFRYLAAQRLGGAVPEYLSLMVSRSITTGYVQMIHIGAPSGEPIVGSGTEPDQEPDAPVATVSIARSLEQAGSVVLEDLEFETGSSNLGDNNFKSLVDLAAYLNANPNRAVALVGHTDAEGALAGNITLSKRRAESVMRRLVTAYDVPPEQVQAEGVGYLAPRDTNLTPEGRTKNRRVEVVLTSTQ